jgi:hypothetical protein
VYDTHVAKHARRTQNPLEFRVGTGFAFVRPAMKRIHVLGSWAVLAAGCSFNQAPKPPDDVTPPEVILKGEAISAKVAPAPISGGTLIVSKKGPFAFASNPDANLVDVIDLEKKSVVWHADMGDGAEPGRLVEDDAGVVHVVLRRAGAIAAIDPIEHTITKRDVCPAPRGIVSQDGRLVVACQGGELVSFSPTGVTTTIVDGDLRDIVPGSNGAMFVTRFRSAELLTLQPNGTVIGRAQPPEALDRIIDAKGNVTSARFLADVAWRSALAPDGSVYVLHQYATTRPISIKRQVQEAAPYGGGNFDPCGNSKLVVPALTRYLDGHAPETARLHFDAPGFDMAVHSSGLVAIAGANEVTAFTPTFGDTSEDCNNGPDRSTVSTDGQPIAVAFASQDRLLIQTRDPATLVIADSRGQGYQTNTVVLSPSTHDTGFAVFHTPTAVGIACVSCHPEGGDDGHVWSFIDLGLRRSQSLRGGILATAPFHWGGDMHDVSQLAHDVFTNRMGGGSLSEPQVGVLASWIDRQPALPRAVRSPDAVSRGQALFASSGCIKCHSGAHLTNNENADVGTGGSFQVPSLIGVANRAPFMHDGCAPTLVDRFTNAKCGGDKHGDTSKLTGSDISDLVSYLESL